VESARAFFEAHPALLVMAMLVGIGGLVVGFIAVLMARRGQSLRPIIWFAVFFGLILAPQVAYHVAVALGVIGEFPTWAPGAVDEHAPSGPTQVAVVDDAGMAVDGERFVSLQRVFGADVDPDLVRDAKPVFGPTFADAEIAQLAFFASGETVVAARFPDAAAARRGRDAWLWFFGLNPSTPGDVVTVTRSVGDRARLAVAERALFAWTGADDGVLAKRQAAIDVLGIESAPAAPAVPGPPPLDWRLFALLVVVELVLVVLWFFKGLVWATTSEAPAGSNAVPAPELERRLLAVDDGQVPFTVRPSDEPGAVEAEWRYADARFVDLARMRGLRRTHRFVVRLDPDSRTARVREYWAAYDWSVGRGGGDLAWQGGTGITFFEVRHERVLGVQVGPDGPGKGVASYAYTFDLETMRRPLKQTVLDAGWRWRPLAWDAPRPLRWLTG